MTSGTAGSHEASRRKMHARPADGAHPVDNSGVLGRLRRPPAHNELMIETHLRERAGFHPRPHGGEHRGHPSPRARRFPSPTTRRRAPGPPISASAQVSSRTRRREVRVRLETCALAKNWPDSPPPRPVVKPRHRPARAHGRADEAMTSRALASAGSSATPVYLCYAPSPLATPLFLVQWRVKGRSRGEKA